MTPLAIIGLSVLVVFLCIVAATLISRYRMCPPDRILVVYGKVSTASPRVATMAARPS